MKLRIALSGKNRAGQEIMQLRLQSRGHQVIPLHDFKSAPGILYLDPPDLIIVDLSEISEEEEGFLKEMRQESYFTPVPIIALVQNSFMESTEWSKYPIDDFISTPVKYAELFTRIDLSMKRIRRVFDNNPLTRLPGNTSIQRAVEKNLGKEVAVCYLDINHFKPYNDLYGFARGDEVIHMVGRIISNAVKTVGDQGFAGHIGGDDFVFISPLKEAERVCKTILEHFDMIVSDLFGDREKSQKYYLANNRKGEEEEIPLLSIAIGVIPLTLPSMSHYGKVAESAAGLKKLAKKSTGSCYVFERRQN
jgi:diguanylate cyclase (GGDEF)-like protein